ncbi:DIS3-like exonuclease 2 [Uranotaenia lowii]|uniref:DIS3-like exonuclease 2 n=1 Tax=Uranotaenia lowii TaxID=190385 RepID=UPI00247892B3|nr:DIS3-like exonuclease 2 [Uranotaenia lowii]
MLENDFVREIMEDMKKNTAKMLENTQPSTDPLPNDEDGNVNDADSDGAQQGIEFVELVSANKPLDESGNKKKGKKSQKLTKKGSNSHEGKNPDQLNNILLQNLEKLKKSLQLKKRECQKLDGAVDGLVPETSKGSSSTKSEISQSDHSKVESMHHENHKAANSKKKSSSISVVSLDQKEINKQKKAIKLQMKNISAKLKKMQIQDSESAEASTSEPKKAKVKETSIVGVTKAGTSEIKPAKVQKSSDGKKSGSSSTIASDPDIKAAQQPKSNKYKPEYQMLLTLLTLDQKHRNDYLIKLGKEYGILKSTGSEVHIKPKLYDFATELSNRALVQCYGPEALQRDNSLKISSPFMAATNINKIRERKLRTFEDEVSYLLNNGKVTEKEDYNPELTLENVSKAEKNGYMTEENQAALKKLVDRLLEQDVGYMVEGAIRVNVNNNAQAFVDDPTREANVYINSILMRKCAMDGDIVRVFVKHNNDEKEGKDGALNTSKGSEDSKDSRMRNNWGFVVDILERKNSRTCVGMFSPPNEKYGKSSHYLSFRPRDFRIPIVRIYRQNWPDAVFKNNFEDIEKVIYQAEILEWHNDEPIGNILKSIGKSGELETETQAVLVQYELDVSSYSEEIINSLPASPFKIPQDEIDKREDLRGECVFTIDPLTARDLDDALSCKVLKNGNFEIGVHISDVTYFLKEGSELDELVKLRATSIYMVDSVYHMLPKPLCFLCSLLPGEDKLAFSVFWEITRDAQIVKTRFARTVINSCAQLAYEHAQVMLDNPSKNLDPNDFPPIFHEYTPNFLSGIVNQLQSIALQLRARRMENGCLKINQPKLSFTLDPKTGEPTAFSVYELRTSNQMIEDFMLLANTSVAEFTHSKFKDQSILRFHPPPNDNQINNLAASLAKHGYSLNIESSKSLADSIEQLVNGSAYPDATRAAINVLIAKPMQRARYFCSSNVDQEEDFYHYALAIPKYTHFTSPIRRYADCMVHRVLSAALELTEPPTRTADDFFQLTNICNVKKYYAKLAGDASSLLYFKHYLRKVKAIETEAAVLEIGSEQMELVLIEIGLVLKASYKRPSKAAAKPGAKPKKDASQKTVATPNKASAPIDVKLFAKLRVTIAMKKDAVVVTKWQPVESKAEGMDTNPSKT